MPPPSNQSRVVADFISERQDILYEGIALYPDEQIPFLSKVPFRFLMVADNRTHLLVGESLESAVVVGEVLSPSEQTTDFDHGYAGICAFYQADHGTIYGLYHAEDRILVENSTKELAYWAIGLAVSTDQGKTFEKRGCILKSSTPKSFLLENPHYVHVGIGDVTAVAKDGYLYAYYTDLSRRVGNDKSTIGMARCPITDLDKLSAWKKYENGDFRSPGIGGNESAIVIATANPHLHLEVIQPHVSFIADDWNIFLMICVIVSNADLTERSIRFGGIGFCTSEDGLHWSTPVLIFATGCTNPTDGLQYEAHPTLLVNQTSEEELEGRLLTCFAANYQKGFPDRMHRLAARTIRFRKRR